MNFEAFFLPSCAEDGRRFCLFHPPEEGAPRRGSVVYIHPFAEEMNKSRRMAALQARAMAVAGYAVLQIDLGGCGDSSGDFGDASWDGWLADVELACDWLLQRGDTELWLWGLRSGGLLAAVVAARRNAPCHLLLWQPVISGRQFLQQFLRLKLAGEMAAGDGKGVMDGLRRQLARGEAVEVAGYALAPALARGLEQAELSPAAGTGRIEWIEVSARTDGALSPAAAACLEKWQAVGLRVRGRQVSGPAFWQTADIEECPALIEASLRALVDAENP